jgi:hypothetical protein
MNNFLSSAKMKIISLKFVPLCNITQIAQPGCSSKIISDLFRDHLLIEMKIRTKLF